MIGDRFRNHSHSHSLSYIQIRFLEQSHGEGSGIGLLPLASLAGTNEPKMEYNRCTSWGRMGSTELVRAQEASRSAVGFVKSGKTSNCE
jgi:hypothetical protein